MTISKGPLVESRESVALKQVIIFGSLFSLVSISSALGYGLYVSVPAFQSVFLKLVAIGS